jgi:1,4-dihydroxy-2-naphthoate octaprenyltransferase
MATPAQWIEGVRLRTLPAALAPVVAGTGVAVHAGTWDPVAAGLCLVVALALQVGVNFANDYSDGIRGTDAERVGPLRLVGSGVAEPRVVKAAAFACFGLAAVAGVVLVVLGGEWWMLVVGAACILAAWYYTGGKHPYGYLGLGEVFVFVFFGLVAVAGTTYVQLGRVPVESWWAAVMVGNLACAVLVANNLRDIATDVAAGKRTLATILKDDGTRWLYASLAITSLIALAGVALLTTTLALIGLVAAPLLVWTTFTIVRGATGRRLVDVLRLTGIAELVASIGMAVGLVIG